MYANCPECERETRATVWYDDLTDEQYGCVFCDFCGWNDNGSTVWQRIRQEKTAASLGLTVEAFQAQLRDEARTRWLAADPELAPF